MSEGVAGEAVGGGLGLPALYNITPTVPTSTTTTAPLRLTHLTKFLPNALAAKLYWPPPDLATSFLPGLMVRGGAWTYV